MDPKKVLLSVKDLVVKFRVRGRVLTAIRGISLDIYENESIAIVGESGSGKSVFTKTFAGMLDQNGFIDQGDIIFDDPELSKTNVAKGFVSEKMIRHAEKKLNQYYGLEYASDIYLETERLKAEEAERGELSAERLADYQKKKEELLYQKTELFNESLTFSRSTDKETEKKNAEATRTIEGAIKNLEREMENEVRSVKAAVRNDKAGRASYRAKLGELKKQYQSKKKMPVTEEAAARNQLIAKEIYLSIGRYGIFSRIKLLSKLLKAFKKAMKIGVNVSDERERSKVFDTVAFRVQYLGEDEKMLMGNGIINLAKVKYSQDWTQVRGRRIATIFQDPMTSLNPIITIGNQITSIILKHQDCGKLEARRRAITLMKKVGIPNAEKRFDDYPFQYSGGMRQRIVIAIALSCQPKILICDEPTTALDVTIQAQILKLLKDLQKEFNYTIVFITHDLGVVANVADRVAVLYAGQIVELGTVEEVFYDPRHPYTWALLSSLPQLAQRNTKLYSITGTPPSLYNQITGDPFAPRNPYCLKIDTLKEPPMFQVTETHFAKTWLLDPRAPKLTKPEIIHDIHGTLIKAFNI